MTRLIRGQLMAAAWATVLCAGTCAARHVALLEVTPRTGQVGEIAEGERDFVSYTFGLHNTGSDTLRISEVRAGCRCTRTEYDSVIAPGDSGHLTQVVDIKGFHEGPFERSIQVYSNSDRPVMPLRVIGIVRSFVEVDKLQMDVPAGGQRFSRDATVGVRSRMENLEFSNAEFIVPDIEGPPWQTRLPVALDLRLTPTGKVDKDGYRYYDLDVWCPYEVEVPAAGEFRVRTNHAREPLIRMRGALMPAEVPHTGEDQR